MTTTDTITREEAKHTPGEWTPDGIDVFASFGTDDQRLIAECKFPSSSPEEESEANVRLIAAAPDMLALLQELAGGYRYEGMFLSYCKACLESEGHKEDCTAKRINDLITKATKGK